MGTARIGWAVAAVVFVCVACSKKDSGPAREPPGAGPAFDATAPAPAPPQADPAPIVVVEPTTRAARTDFRGRMSQGRAFEKQGKYAEAMAEFEAALVIAPNHARALSELGWAAFKGGKLERSIEASRGAVSDEKDPRVAGASLYNLGRALEAQQDREGARRAYRDSLEVRPNQVVLERYLSLGGRLETWASAPTCGATPKPMDALCDCFRGGDDAADDPDFETEVTCESKDLGGWVMYTVNESDDRTRGSFQTFLGRRTSGGIELLAQLGTGGLGPKAMAEVTIEAVKQRTVGTRRVLEVQVSSTYDDEEVMTFVASRHTKGTAYCVEQATRLRCTEAIPIEVEWSVHIGSEDVDEPDIAEWFVKEYGAKPPVSWRFQMKTEVAADGTLRVRSVSGIKGYEASYELW
jgi:hypothetical protein